MESLLPRVKSRLFIHANRRSTNLLDGEYASIQSGRSLDFDDLRAYVPGDEVDDIDWKATARFGAPLVKRYLQTRRQNVYLVVDTGRGMAALAAGGEPKRDVAIDVAGVLGYLSIRHGDSVGMITRSDGRIRSLPARASERYLESLLRRVSSEVTLDAPTGDLGELVTFLVRGIRNRSIVVVIADDVVPDLELDDALRKLTSRHEMLWITIADLDLVRGDGSRREVLDVDDDSPIPAILRRDRRLAGQYRAAIEYHVAAQANFYSSLGVSHARVDSADQVVPTLLALLRRRRRAGY